MQFFFVQFLSPNFGRTFALHLKIPIENFTIKTSNNCPIKFSPCDHRKSIFTCSLPDGSRSTQKSVCSCWCRAIKSSNVMVVLALKTSSIGALWNTVMPNVEAFSTSWMNVSFQTGSNVFCLMLERSAKRRWRDKIYDSHKHDDDDVIAAKCLRIFI